MACLQTVAANVLNLNHVNTIGYDCHVYIGPKGVTIPEVHVICQQCKFQILHAAYRLLVFPIDKPTLSMHILHCSYIGAHHTSKGRWYVRPLCPAARKWLRLQENHAHVYIFDTQHQRLPRTRLQRQYHMAISYFHIRIP